MPYDPNALGDGGRIPPKPIPPPFRILREGESPWACCGGGAANHAEGPCAAQLRGEGCRYGRRRHTSNGPPRCAGGRTEQECRCAAPRSLLVRCLAWIGLVTVTAPPPRRQRKPRPDDPPFPRPDVVSK